MEKRFYLKSELGKMLMPAGMQNPTRLLFLRIHKDKALMQQIRNAGYSCKCRLVNPEASALIIAAFADKKSA